MKNTAYGISWIGCVRADRHQDWVTTVGFGSSVCTVINLLLCTVSNFSSSEFCDVLPCQQRQDWFRNDILVIFSLTVQLRNLAFLTWVKDKKKWESLDFYSQYTTNSKWHINWHILNFTVNHISGPVLSCEVKKWLRIRVRHVANELAYRTYWDRSHTFTFVI